MHPKTRNLLGGQASNNLISGRNAACSLFALTRYNAE